MFNRGRSNTVFRTPTGAMNLDSRGRVNAFNPGGTSRDAYNFWRRKSNGGMGG